MRPMAILLLLAILLTLFGFSPFSRHEISEMLPAELLCLQKSAGGVLAKTEDGLSAWGQTLPQALQALADAAPGELFFATVENLILTELSPEPETLDRFGIRPGTAMYTSPAVEDAKALNEYLKAHPGGVTLGLVQEQPHTPIPGPAGFFGGGMPR